jgi:hypothetical protein
LSIAGDFSILRGKCTAWCLGQTVFAPHTGKNKQQQNNIGGTDEV